MSSKIKPEDISRTELRVFIIRHYKNQKEFCESNKINYGTFKKFMAGDNTLPGIAKSVLRIIKRKNYSISTIINPGTRLHIEAAAV